MKSLFAGLGLLLGSFLILFFGASTPIAFESLESKTVDGQPVFNEVSAQLGFNKDIWFMRQSHQGVHSPRSVWDRLAIVVDRTKSPTEATFYEFAPGETMTLEEPKVPLKARCFACHANGPRAIRPNFQSHDENVSMWQTFRIALLNLRIKTYGQVSGKTATEFQEGAPFRSRHRLLAQPLGLKTCEKCHSSGGFRNELQIEHAGTAHFLVSHGDMPPFPFRATDEEKQKLAKLAGAE